MYSDTDPLNRQNVGEAAEGSSDFLADSLNYGAEALERLQLRGQLLVLSLVKMLLLALLTLSLAISAWLLAMLSLAQLLAEAGLPQLLALPLLLVVNLLAFYICRGQLVRALRGLRISEPPAASRCEEPHCARH